MLRICLGFSQGHLEILLVHYVSQCLLLRMEHCLAMKQGARKEDNINTICTSLASSGDVNIGQVEKGTNKKKFPDFLQLPVAFFVFLAGLGLGNMWHHLHHAAHFSILCGRMLPKFSC